VQSQCVPLHLDPQRSTNPLNEIDLAPPLCVSVSVSERLRQTKLFTNCCGDYLKIRIQRGLDEVYELLGRNLSGSYLHVVYRVLPDWRLRVFHMNGMTETQKRVFGDTEDEEDETEKFQG
jgi:hypothetical protein